jgi:antitoxin VapB
MDVGTVRLSQARTVRIVCLFEHCPSHQLDIAHLLTYAQGICQSHPEPIMPEERHVSLFRNGRNQAVRIPREFELAGNDAIMWREGTRLIIEAVPDKHPLLALLETLEPLDEDFPDVGQAPLADEAIF